MQSAEPILSLRGIGKAFYGNRVLSDVSFDVAAGEIVGLVGENGAGKSTLMKILFAMPEIAETGGFEGKVVFDGQEEHFKSPFDALDAGIGMVHQEFSLIPGFTTTENILLNRESLKRSLLDDIFGERIRSLDRPAMEGRARHAIDKLGVSLDPKMLVKEMPVGHKQFTEIARELCRENVKLIVLDEPTAVLTESEAEVLLHSLKTLAAEGIAIIFISHRLREVVELCDRVVVLRDGHKVNDFSAKGTTTKEIAAAAGVSEAMVFRHFASKDELYAAILDTKGCQDGVHRFPWEENEVLRKAIEKDLKTRYKQHYFHLALHE